MRPINSIKSAVKIINNRKNKIKLQINKLKISPRTKPPLS